MTRDETDVDAPPSVTVVEAVAELTGRSPLEMQPFAEAIAPDALDDLLNSDDTDDAAIEVTFEYCDCRVTASSAEVRISRRD